MFKYTIKHSFTSELVPKTNLNFMLICSVLLSKQLIGSPVNETILKIKTIKMEERKIINIVI